MIENIITYRLRINSISLKEILFIIIHRPYRTTEVVCLSLLSFFFLWWLHTFPVVSPSLQILCVFEPHRHPITSQHDYYKISTVLWLYTARQTRASSCCNACFDTYVLFWFLLKQSMSIFPILVNIYHYTVF